MKINIKTCPKCSKEKSLRDYHIDRKRCDGLNIYCKRCVTEKSLKVRGITDELSHIEQSLLLKYFPYTHRATSIICKNPTGRSDVESEPLTIADIAQENNLTFSETQGIFYKFTRLRLTTMIIRADEEGVIITYIYYKKENIREYIIKN